MIERATYDESVVAEWGRRRSAFRRSSRWVWWPFWIAALLAPLPFVSGTVDAKPGAFVVVFILLFVGLYLRYRHITILTCPHCGKRPAPDRFGQVALGEVDCCPHCSYWLIDLHGSREKT
jgi:hypothetical protein